jgi:hypothetical protein
MHDKGELAIDGPVGKPKAGMQQVSSVLCITIPKSSAEMRGNIA